MAVIQVEVPDELEERLQRECGLLGFEDPETYLRWLVDNRATMQGDEEQNRILAAYAERVRDLEGRLEAADGDRSADDADERTGDPGTAGADPAVAEGDDGVSVSADGGTTTAVGDANGAGPAEESPPAPPEDGGPETFEANLAPATARISDDSVTEVADELKRAQGEAVDEMARQAVAKTRRQLGEGTGTGLSYRSTTALRSDGPRPGSDIADLDAVEVPGYDEELIELRREAVGAALAFLKDVGQAKRSAFVDHLYEEFPAGYGSEDGWWECIKRGLRQLDRVDAAGDGSRIWRYRDFKGRVKVLEE